MKKCRFTDNGNLSDSHPTLSLSSDDTGRIDTTLTNSIIVGNEGKFDANAGIKLVGMATSSQNFKFINSTITDNQCDYSGCGLYIWGQDTSQLTVSLVNSILSGNKSTREGSGIDLDIIKKDSASINVSGEYSILGDIKDGGVSAIFSNSMLASPGLNSSYHLRQGSPAIDAGKCGQNVSIGGQPAYLRIAPWDDIDGESRPGDGVLLGCDIGADEYHAFLWPMFLPAIIGKIQQ